MTIDEAIRRVADQADLLTKDKEYPLECALKLGIEALKAWQLIRSNPGFSFDTLLPGETEK